MVDVLTPEQRRLNMSRNRGSNTAPELAVRKLLRELGCTGYRLHLTDLPGRPDIVFRRCRRVIFVHGCFWHLHSSCREGRIPFTRSEYWAPKLNRNQSRDANHLNALRAAGWQVLIVWECEIRDLDPLKDRIRRFLEE